MFRYVTLYHNGVLPYTAECPQRDPGLFPSILNSVMAPNGIALFDLTSLGLAAGGAGSCAKRA